MFRHSFANFGTAFFNFSQLKERPAGKSPCWRKTIVPWRALAALEMAKAKAGDRQDCPHSVRMALVAASAATAEAATFPIDFGKTRVQLHSGRWGLG